MRHEPPTPVSVVIAAHDEAAVIGRCLRALTTGAEPRELEIVVVCNGCRDGTAAAARAAYADAVVVELPEPSKAVALNVGDTLVTRFPRFFVDADVTVTIDALRATARLLEPGTGVLCASPRPVFELEGRSWPIRAYYDTWDRLPYLNDDVVGTGMYALSAEGRRRFGGFPILTADDQFVLEQFARGERRSVAGATFTVHTPTSLRGLTMIRRRAYRGARELEQLGHVDHADRADRDDRSDGPRSSGRALLRLARAPRRVPAVTVYVAVTLVARTAVWCSPSSAWERDDSARQVAR
jgi:hypothetical protein